MKKNMNIKLVRTNRIASMLSSDVENGTIITGVHFVLNGNSPKLLNAGTVESFAIALQLYSNCRKANSVSIGVLLNDIGQVCGEHCSIIAKPEFSKTSFEFPKEYSELLKIFKLSPSDVSIFCEKHMRNRGKKLFRKIKSTQIERISSTDSEYYLTINDDEENILLLRRNKTDAYGTPACPLIMSAYGLEQARGGFTSSLNLYYIDTDNLTNIPNHLVIEKGKKVAEFLGAKILIKNVYITNKGLFKNYE